MTGAGLFALVVAAFLEISGDVRIGKGLVTANAGGVLLGGLLLILYGVVVNGYNWLTRGMNFSKMLGVYIAVFAAVNLALALRRPGEVSRATIVGTILIVCGGLIIQFGELVPRG